MAPFFLLNHHLAGCGDFSGLGAARLLALAANCKSASYFPYLARSRALKCKYAVVLNGSGKKWLYSGHELHFCI
ncbi:hypothetical protein NYE69_30905 [Paenibacillus sp. FSL R5-0527]|uniref:hypothetical protein n=1 Tax=Paenibacillus TaxID=44249 RepID=UPI002E23B89B|nr:hypothetical protein [Paenibacillus macerans]